MVAPEMKVQILQRVFYIKQKEDFQMIHEANQVANQEITKQEVKASQAPKKNKKKATKKVEKPEE